MWRSLIAHVQNGHGTEKKSYASVCMYRDSSVFRQSSFFNMCSDHTYTALTLNMTSTL